MVPPMVQNTSYFVMLLARLQHYEQGKQYIGESEQSFHKRRNGRRITMNDKPDFPLRGNRITLERFDIRK